MYCVQAFGGRGFELNDVKLSQVRLNRIRFSRNEPNFAGVVFYCLDFEVFFIANSIDCNK